MQDTRTVESVESFTTVGFRGAGFGSGIQVITSHSATEYHRISGRRLGDFGDIGDLFLKQSITLDIP